MPYQILLVDDDHAFREEFREALEGYDVIEASNGKDALDQLRRPNTIDLVILDVMMPGVRGTEILKEMKRISPNLFVIIITGYSSAGVAIDALKGRADDFIEKPVNIEKVKRTIDQILRRKDDGGGIESLDVKGKVERAKIFAERNSHMKVSLEDAARIVGFSPKYLSRVFKEVAGVGFAEYRLSIKIQKAKELLDQTTFNINQISDRLGYENVESFIRAFRKFAQCTPTEFRKRKVAEAPMAETGVERGHRVMP